MEELIAKLEMINRRDGWMKYGDYVDAVMSANISDFYKGWLRCILANTSLHIKSDTTEFGDNLINYAKELL